MNTRGLISYLWRPLIGLGKKLVHLPLSGSCNHLLKISFSIGFRNMKSTHVYSFGHDLINIKIKMLKKYQIPEINAVKPEKAEKIKEKANQPVKEMSMNDRTKTLVFF